MMKSELVAAIAKEANIPKAGAEKALNAFTSSVTKALKKGAKLTLTEFGTFSVVKRKSPVTVKFVLPSYPYDNLPSHKKSSCKAASTGIPCFHKPLHNPGL